MTRSGPGDTRLIVMARWPEPGRVKTRLAKAIGAREAATAYEEIAAYCVRRMKATAISLGERLEVRLDGSTPHQARRWLGYGIAIRRQNGGTLGDRLASAAASAFAGGAKQVVLVGSDCPDLSGDDVRAALASLSSGVSVALGPAMDGGYYLIALSVRDAETVIPALLEYSEITWGSNQVLEETLRAASRAGVAVDLLPRELSDIDRPEDLERWDALKSRHEFARQEPTIAAIIPTLDESEMIVRTIESCRAAGIDDIIVVDGGSSDGTVELASSAGARVTEAPRGRASQMNAGARVASADVLCFLHADTRLPAMASTQITDSLSDPTVSAGAFKYGVGAAQDVADMVNEAAGDLRYTLFGLPYGDQALFCRRQDFEDLGRYTEIPVMEDYELSERMREFGRIATAPGSVESSTRGWREHGLARMTITNMGVIAGYRMGVPVGRLAEWRRRVAR